MRSQIDWRHAAAAALAVALIVAAGWKILARSYDAPRAEAPAGPHARMQDAPETPPPGLPGR